MQNKRTSCFPCLFPAESSSQTANVCLSELTDVIRFYKLTGYGSHLSSSAPSCFTFLLPVLVELKLHSVATGIFLFVCLLLFVCLQSPRVSLMGGRFKMKAAKVKGLEGIQINRATHS